MKLLATLNHTYPVGKQHCVTHRANYAQIHPKPAAAAAAYSVAANMANWHLEHVQAASLQGVIKLAAQHMMQIIQSQQLSALKAHHSFNSV